MDIINPSATFEELLSGLTADFIETYVLRAGSMTISEGIQQGRDSAIETLEPNGVQYSAALDEKICPICSSLDGMVVDLRTEEGRLLHEKYHPAMHHNCRCLWIYIFEKKFENETKNFEDVWVEKFRAENPDKKNWSKAQILDRYAQWNVYGSRSHLWQNEWEELMECRKEVLERRIERAEKKFLENLKSLFLATAENYSEQPVPINEDDIISALDKFGITVWKNEKGEKLSKEALFEKFKIKSWADPEGEDLALTLINQKLLDNFTDLPEYKGLKDKFDIKRGGFKKLDDEISGEFDQEEQIAWINKKLRGDVFTSISPNAPDIKLSSLDITYLYAQLHEDLHGLTPGKYKKESIETVLEETITGSLSRLYLRDFITSNKLNFDKKTDEMIQAHFNVSGYGKNYLALESITGYLGKNFKEYCLELKMARTTEARIEILKRDYRILIARKMGIDLEKEELPKDIERGLNIFENSILYENEDYATMVIERIINPLKEVK